MQILQTGPQVLERVTALFGPCFSAPERLRAELVRFARGEFLTMAQQPLARLCFLLEGETRIFATTENGAEFFVADSRPPGFIGDVEFATRQPSAENVEARTAVTAAALPLTRENIAALEEDLLFHKFVMRQLAQKMGYLGGGQRARETLTLAERAERYIRLMALDGEFRGVSGLADNLRCSYRTALRVLARLCGAGVLTRAGYGTYRVNPARRDAQ